MRGMKPNFALGLSHDGIALLHRANNGWLIVGEVALDDPRFSETLGFLRSTALGLEPHGIATKLVLPNSEVLYTKVHAPGPGSDAQKRQIAEALDGLTPYAVTELAFDWTGNGPEVQVAAVALETLQEAEDFAVQNRFNPVSFVARPDPEQFSGEPFFGLTRAAAKLPDGGAGVVPDRVPVTITGRAKPPAPQPAPPKDSAPVAPTGDTPVAPKAASAPPATGITAAAPAGAKPSTSGPDGPTGSAGAGAPRLPQQPATPATGTTTGKDAQGTVAQLRSIAPDAHRPPPPVVAFSTRREATALAPEENVEEAPPATGRVTLPPPPPPRKSGFAALTEGLRKGFGARKTAPTPAAATTSRDSNVQPLQVDRSPLSGKTAAPDTPSTQDAQKQDTQKDEAEALTVFGARKGQALTHRRRVNTGLMLTGVLLLLLVAVAIWAAYFMAPPSQQQLAEQPLPTQEPLATVTPPEPLPLEPAPGVTLPELITPEPTAPEVPAEAPVAEAPAAPATEPDPEPVTEADTTAEAPAAIDSSAIESIAIESIASAISRTLEEAAAAQPEATQPPPAPEAAQPAEIAGAESAPEGLWPFAPETTGEPQLSRSEVQPAPLPDPTVAVPLAAPRPELAETALSEMPVPAVPEGGFDLDERGFVQATPEGALSPRGVMVYAGQPPLVPRPRAEVLPESLVLPVGTADPELAGARPEPRPDGIAAAVAAALLEAAEGIDADADSTSPTRPEDSPDEAAPEDDQSSLQSPPGGVALTSLRPASRPSDLAAPAEDPAPASAIRSDSALAVATSLQPSARPSDFAQTVQQALASARSAPAAPAASATATAAAAPAAPAAAPSSIPTRASVAEQATETRAINLRRVNLIGVFGTQNDRRALVRLSNGQVVRVRVGDRLDGGQVAAIGENELRYIKSGRNHVLTIGQSG